MNHEEKPFSDSSFCFGWPYADPGEQTALSLPVDALLRPGDRDQDVKCLQKALRSIGYDLEIDGVFGRITQECLKSFQASRQLERDGIAGPLTWSALQEVCQNV